MRSVQCKYLIITLERLQIFLKLLSILYSNILFSDHNGGESKPYSSFFCYDYSSSKPSESSSRCKSKRLSAATSTSTAGKFQLSMRFTFCHPIKMSCFVKWCDLIFIYNILSLLLYIIRNRETPQNALHAEPNLACGPGLLVFCSYQ